MWQQCKMGELCSDLANGLTSCEACEENWKVENPPVEARTLENSGDCVHCEAVGNLEACEKTECNIHKSWYAKKLQQAILKIAADLKKTTKVG